MRAMIFAAALTALSLSPAHARGANIGCLRPAARSMLHQIEQRMGPVEVISTCGGRHVKNSQHYRGMAVDFRPRGLSLRAGFVALKSMASVGGIGIYGSHLHADARAERYVWGGGHRVARRRINSRARYAMMR